PFEPFAIAEGGLDDGQEARELLAPRFQRLRVGRRVPVLFHALVGVAEDVHAGRRQVAGLEQEPAVHGSAALERIRYQARRWALLRDVPADRVRFPEPEGA